MNGWVISKGNLDVAKHTSYLSYLSVCTQGRHSGYRQQHSSVSRIQFNRVERFSFGKRRPFLSRPTDWIKRQLKETTTFRVTCPENTGSRAFKLFNLIISTIRKTFYHRSYTIQVHASEWSLATAQTNGGPLRHEIMRPDAKNEPLKMWNNRQTSRFDAITGVRPNRFRLCECPLMAWLQEIIQTKGNFCLEWSKQPFAIHNKQIALFAVQLEESRSTAPYKFFLFIIIY